MVPQLHPKGWARLKEFKLKPQVIPEKVVENQILVYLWYLKIWAWKNQSVGIYDTAKKIYRRSHNKFHIKGVSDILGILPPGGRTLAIEVKSAVGRPSPEQMVFIDMVNQRGGLAFVARSVKEVEEKLKQEGIIDANTP